MRGYLWSPDQLSLVFTFALFTEKNKFFHWAKIRDFNIFYLCVKFIFYPWSTTCEKKEFPKVVKDILLILKRLLMEEPISLCCFDVLKEWKSCIKNLFLIWNVNNDTSVVISWIFCEKNIFGKSLYIPFPILIYFAPELWLVLLYTKK